MAGGQNANTPSKPDHSVFQTWNTTPNATAMIAVTTMSRVRHAVGDAAIEFVVAIIVLILLYVGERTKLFFLRD